jgi:hypothetical protein
MPRNQNEQPLANPINPTTHNTLPSFDRHQHVPGANSNSLSTNQQQLPTASPFFVPFLCAVAGLEHSEIENVQNQVNAVHDRMWETMVQRNKFVHQYVLTPVNEIDRARVNQTSWPWQRLGQHCTFTVTIKNGFLIWNPIIQILSSHKIVTTPNLSPTLLVETF